MAQFVQAAIGYGNTSVTTKRLQSFCRRNHLLSPGNFSLFGEHSDLSPRNLLLVHGHRQRQHVDGGLHLFELNRLSVQELEQIRGQIVDLICDTGQSLSGQSFGLLDHTFSVLPIEVFVLTVVGHLVQIAVVVEKSFSCARSILEDFVYVFFIVVVSHCAGLQWMFSAAGYGFSL